jgi:hypothetical protein
MDNPSMRFYVLARTALFIALGAVFKASLSFIPNVELLTFWVFVNTLLYGYAYGAFIGVASNILSDIFFTGFGPWSIFVSLAFALAALFFHVWSGKRISLVPFIILSSVSLFFLIYLAYLEKDSLTRVVGWGFFILGMSAFAFRLGRRIYESLSDSGKKIGSAILKLFLGAFLLFILQGFMDRLQMTSLSIILLFFILFWSRLMCALSYMTRRILGKRAGYIEGIYRELSRNKSLVWAALICTVIWDVFTVITTNVMLFGQPLMWALYAQYGIIPPTFYPFGIVHTVNNILLITLLGKRTIHLIESAEKYYV